MKEEAIRLVDRFRNICRTYDEKGIHSIETEDYFAKRCALICVEEMEREVGEYAQPTGDYYQRLKKYYQRLKKEIEAL